MRLFIATLVVVALFGGFLAISDAPSVEACGGMTTIAPPPFDPVPEVPADDPNPFNTEIDEVIL